MFNILLIHMIQVRVSSSCSSKTNKKNVLFKKKIDMQEGTNEI